MISYPPLRPLHGSPLRDAAYAYMKFHLM